MRPIDADAILSKMGSVMDMQDVYLPVHFMEMVIDDMPTIEAESVRHGKWTVKGGIYPECSECGELSDYNCDGMHTQSRYCPHCGAKMEDRS